MIDRLSLAIPRGESLRVAVAGPVLTEPLAQFLDGDTARLPQGLGGTSVWQLVSDLVGRGQLVSVVTLDESVSRPLIARGRMLRVAYGPYRSHHRMRDLMRVERHAVRDGLRREQPDLVHAHWCYEYALGALSSGIPTLITVRDWIPTILRMTEARFLPYWCGRALLYFATLARATHLTANSPYVAGRVRRLTKASLEVVPNGMPDADFATPHAMDARFAEPSGERALIVSVNNGFGPLKNLGALLHTIRVLRKRGVDCELQLIGNGYGPGGPGGAWAQKMGLAEGVTFMGPLSRDDVLARMREATILVHPAREESFGMTLLEAMSQGTPVIGGARSGAVPWVLDEGRAGLLVDVDDPRAIADAVEAVITRPAFRRGVGAAGYDHAWRNFRQSRVTTLYLDAYRRLLAEMRSR